MQPTFLSRRADLHGVLHFEWQRGLRRVIANDRSKIFAIAKKSVFSWSIQISPCCKQIYGPWMVSLGHKSNTTTISSDRQRIWSNHIVLVQTFITHTFERLLPLDSVFRLNAKFNENRLGKTKNMVNSQFFPCNFCNTNWFQFR